MGYVDLKKWDTTTRPTKSICPEKYCFLWHGDKCGEAYKSFNSNYDCIRKPLCQPDARDWYEPCEPTLRQDELPDDYFS